MDLVFTSRRAGCVTVPGVKPCETPVRWVMASAETSSGIDSFASEVI